MHCLARGADILEGLGEIALCRASTRLRRAPVRLTMRLARDYGFPRFYGHAPRFRRSRRHGIGNPVSTTLESEPMATAENEATQTAWMGDLSGGLGLVRRLVADQGSASVRVARDFGIAGRRSSGRWPRTRHRSTSGRRCRPRSARSSRWCGGCWRSIWTCRPRLSPSGSLDRVDPLVLRQRPAAAACA